MRIGTVEQALGSVPDECTSETFGSEIYYFCGDTRSWTDARARCVGTPGLDLVRIDSAAENAFVVSNMTGQSWLSANDRSAEGAWRWSVGGTDDGPQFWAGSSSGSAVGGLYSNWETGQPNDLGGQDCAVVEGDARWDDKACSDSNAYVCAGDACPDDPNKLEPGICGCGVSDDDTDGDERPDCLDLCPQDPFKVAPGDCGCSNDPVSAGVPCSDGLCSANSACDGAGRCGSGAACAPDASCTFAQSVGEPGRGYYFCTTPLSWTAARAKCQTVPGADLARVDDAAENEFLATQIGGDAWLSGNDRRDDGDWFWAQPGSDEGDKFWDGTAGGYAVNGLFTNWATGQPDNSDTGDCSVMQASNAKWADRNCGTQARYVCEISPAPGIGLQAGAPWPTGGQRPAREARSSSVGAQTSDLNWSTPLNGTTEVGPPVVGADETIYVASGSKLFAVDADGTVAWSFQAAGLIEGAAAIGLDGSIYFGSANGNDGRMYALSSQGSPRWTFDVDDAVDSWTTVGADGTVYFTEGHHVYALDSEGHEKWRFHVGDNDGLSPSVTSAGTIHIGSNGLVERMYAVSPTGRQLWEFDPDLDVLTTAVGVANGTVYFGAGSNLFAVKASGTQLWQAQLGGTSTSPLAIGPDGTIYAGSSGGRLRAFNASNGSTKWTQMLGSELTAAPAVGSDGVVYVATRGGVVEARRPTDGTVLWSRTTSGSLRSALAIGASGTVYVGGGAGDGKLYSIGGNPEPFVQCVAQVGPGRFAAAFGYDNPTTVTIHIPRGEQNQLVPGSTPPSTAIVEDFLPGRTERAFWEVFDGTTTLSWALRGRTAVASAFSPQCALSDFPRELATTELPVDPDRPSGFLESRVLLLASELRNPLHGALLPDPTSGGTGTSSPPGGIGRIQQPVVLPGLEVPFTFSLTSLFPSLVNVGFCDSPDINARVRINGDACGSVEVATCDDINVEGCCPGLTCEACGQKVEASISYSCTKDIPAADQTVEVHIHLDEDGDDVMNKTLTIDLLSGAVISPSGVVDSIFQSSGGWGVGFEFTTTPRPALPSDLRVCTNWNASYIDELGSEDHKGTPGTGQEYLHYPASFAEVALQVQSPLGEARWGAEYDDAGVLVSGEPLFLDAEGCLNEAELSQPAEITPANPNEALDPKELFLFVHGTAADDVAAGGLRAEMWVVSRMRRVQGSDVVNYSVFDVEPGFRSHDPLVGDHDNDNVPDQFELGLKQQHRHVESAHMTTGNDGIPVSSWLDAGFWAVPPQTIVVSAPEWHTNVTRTSAVISRMLATDDMYYPPGDYAAHAYDGCPGDDFTDTSLGRDSCMSGGTLYIGPETPPPNPTACTTDVNCPANQVCVIGLCSWVEGSRWKYVVAHEAGHQIESRARGRGPGWIPYSFTCPNPDGCPNQAHDPGDPDRLQDPFGTDERCRCDHVFAANGLHCLNSIERGDDAFTEGFAQFIAAKTWNSRDQADCNFTYYKEYMEPDFSVRVPPLEIDCAEAVQWRNNYCPMNDLDQTTPEQWADFGTERDWLGFLRATNALSVDRSNLKDFFDAARIACHSNTVNVTPCTWTDIGWDAIFQRDANDDFILGTDGLPLPAYVLCSDLHPVGGGFTCDAQDYSRDPNGQLVVRRGGLREGAQRLLGVTSPKYVHLERMGQTYGVDTNIIPTPPPPSP